MFCQKGPKRVFLNGDTTDAQIGIMSLHVRCMTFADCRLQTADFRPQTADCRLQTTLFFFDYYELIITSSNAN